MAEINSWDKKVITQILLNIDFLITEVNDLETIKGLFYDRDKYSAIVSHIRNKDWEKIKEFDEKYVGSFPEYLYILKFLDQNKLLYVVTVYDNEGLWQDPEIIDIFPLP